MGEIVEDMLEGLSCSHCGVYFKEVHGHPVLCKECFKDETEAEKVDLPEAVFKKM